MMFKSKNVLYATALAGLFLLSSCGDDKKEKEEQQRIETERIDLENAQKVQRETEAKEAKEAEMKEEARTNSIAGKALINEDLSTLSNAVQIAGLSNILYEPGEYTLFAPSNQAFEKMSQKKRDEMMKPENKEQLGEILSYHMVHGVITSDQLAQAIKGGNGSYTFKTVTGGELTASMKGDQFVIKDGSGKKAQVILGNVPASNGIVYIIDTVLMAKK